MDSTTNWDSKQIELSADSYEIFDMKNFLNRIMELLETLSSEEKATYVITISRKD